MLFLEVPPFDVLMGQHVPYSGFGEAQALESELPSRYLQTVDQAVKRLSDVFGIDCTATDSIAKTERVIAEMWKERWNPQEANINLFTTDFGCAVTEALRESLAGTLVLRSETDLSHASVWWPKKGLETFPFHATFKRLTFKDGESLTFFAERVRSLLVTV